MTQPLRAIVRQHVLATLRECRGNKTAACRALGIGRRTIDLWLRRWQVGAPYVDRPALNTVGGKRAMEFVGRL